MTTQPKDLMTLEETLFQLRQKLKNTNLSPEARELCESTIHHLEAGRKECECESFQNAQAPCTDHEMFGEAVRTWDGGFIIGPELPPISFCPWCGGKPPTAQEVNG